MKELVRSILKQYWGYDQFRPLQEDIVLSVLEGKDTLALLPTGGGKSICFQVPGMAKDGICIVISPLIALMKDQVENLKKRGIKAAAIYSGLSSREIESLLSNCAFSDTVKFLYVSPERLKTEIFINYLKRMNVSMFAIDEAHCISQWGYDFRPPYLQIAEIRNYFPDVPVLALTATATPEVVKDIQDKLDFPKINVFQKSFKRDNLTYMVVKEQNKMGRMIRVINHYPGTGIVYVRNRRKTKEIAEYIAAHGISADYYHAGLSSELRDTKQKEWMSGKTRVIVSTNAFGMGIDKPDVRWVIHMDIPDTIEAYFQEAGRGGRDLLPSTAVLLYDDGDLKELKEGFERNFPPIEFIKTVYKELCNHYQIAMGDGENKTFPFHLEGISKTMKVKPLELYSAISFLEKMGILMLNEEGKKCSVVMMSMQSEALEAFYKSNPDSEDPIKLLLRSYGGIFTNYIKIYEEDLAKRSETDVNTIMTQLRELSSKGVLVYIPRTKTPQISFLVNRVEESYLYFSDAVYKTRKVVAKKRLDAVLLFVESTDQCRSQLLLAYFGEKKSTRCGTCDVCLKWNKEQLRKKEHDAIVAEIQKHKGQSNNEIIREVSKSFQEKKVIEVLRMMIDFGF
jgi:ATP-dependent DNA helicase RecQ